MKRNRKPWTLRLRRWTPLVAGGLVLQFNLSSCDAEVRDAFLGGIQSALTGFSSSLTGLMTSVINAVFLSFVGDGQTTQVTAQAVIDAARVWLA